MTALNETRREWESHGTHPGWRIKKVKGHIAASDERRGYSSKYDPSFRLLSHKSKTRATIQRPLLLPQI